MSAMSVSDYITAGVLLTSPLWLFCVAWCIISRSQIKEKMKKGLSFKESVKQVFKESLVNGSGDGSYQYNHNAFDNQQNSFSNDGMQDSPIGIERSSPGWVYNNHDSSIEGNLR
jgi:hypothetical protein